MLVERVSESQVDSTTQVWILNVDVISSIVEEKNRFPQNRESKHLLRMVNVVTLSNYFIQRARHTSLFISRVLHLYTEDQPSKNTFKGSV